ncbi:MAG: hypothetical protein ACRC2R_17975 [Xenococcaceae cyanobacterium]
MAIIEIDRNRTECDRNSSVNLFMLKRLVTNIGGAIEIREKSDRSSTIILQLPILGAKL